MRHTKAGKRSERLKNNYYYPLGAFIKFKERKGTNNNKLTHGIICPYHGFKQLGFGVVYLATNIFKTKKSKTKIGDPCVSVMDATMMHYQKFKVGDTVQVRETLNSNEWKNVVVERQARPREINETDIAKNCLPATAKHRGTLEFIVKTLEEKKNTLFPVLCFNMRDVFWVNNFTKIPENLLSQHQNKPQKRKRTTGAGKKSRKRGRNFKKAGKEYEEKIMQKAIEPVKRIKKILLSGVPDVNAFALQQILQQYCESQMRCYHTEGATDTLRIQTEEKSKFNLCSIYIPDRLLLRRSSKKNRRKQKRMIGIPTDQTSDNGKNPVFKEIMQHALDSNVNVLKSVDKKKAWLARYTKDIIKEMRSEWEAFSQHEVKAQNKTTASSPAVETDGIGKASAGKDIQELKAQQVWIQYFPAVMKANGHMKYTFHSFVCLFVFYAFGTVKTRHTDQHNKLKNQFEQLKKQMVRKLRIFVALCQTCGCVIPGGAFHANCRNA